MPDYTKYLGRLAQIVTDIDAVTKDIANDPDADDYFTHSELKRNLDELQKDARKMVRSAT